MPFTPETQFDNTRPLTMQEVEDVATRAAVKAIMHVTTEKEKEPDLLPALFWMVFGATLGVTITSVTIIFIK